MNRFSNEHKMKLLLKPKTKYPCRIMLLQGTFPMERTKQMGISKETILMWRKMTAADITCTHWKIQGRFQYWQYHFITTFVIDELHMMVHKDIVLQEMEAIKSHHFFNQIKDSAAFDHLFSIVKNYQNPLAVLKLKLGNLYIKMNNIDEFNDLKKLKSFLNYELSDKLK